MHVLAKPIQSQEYVIPALRPPRQKQIRRLLEDFSMAHLIADNKTKQFICLFHLHSVHPSWIKTKLTVMTGMRMTLMIYRWLWWRFEQVGYMLTARFSRTCFLRPLLFCYPTICPVNLQLWLPRSRGRSWYQFCVNQETCCSLLREEADSMKWFYCSLTTRGFHLYTKNCQYAVLEKALNQLVTNYHPWIWTFFVL